MKVLLYFIKVVIGVAVIFLLVALYLYFLWINPQFGHDKPIPPASHTASLISSSILKQGDLIVAEGDLYIEAVSDDSEAILKLNQWDNRGDRDNSLMLISLVNNDSGQTIIFGSKKRIEPGPSEISYYRQGVPMTSDWYLKSGESTEIHFKMIVDISKYKLSPGEYVISIVGLSLNDELHGYVESQLKFPEIYKLVSQDLPSAQRSVPVINPDRLISKSVDMIKVLIGPEWLDSVGVSVRCPDEVSVITAAGSMCKMLKEVKFSIQDNSSDEESSEDKNYIDFQFVNSSKSDKSVPISFTAYSKDGKNLGSKTLNISVTGDDK